MSNNSGLWLIVLIASCFAARITGQPRVGRKGRVYIWEGESRQAKRQREKL